MPVEFGPAAPVDGNLAEDFFELRRRWFDRWIKGLANGVDEEPSVRVFIMGGGSGRRNRDGRLDHGGRWRSAAEWPLPQTRWTPLYLHADRSLAAEPAAGSGAVDDAFDPHHPAPTLGGAISSGEPVMHAGAFDQSAAALRLDVLVFATPPLDHDSKSPARLRCDCGSPLTLPTQTSRRNYPPSADFPHGFAMNLTEGLLRVRYRNSWERPAPMVPGEVYAITIELSPIANLFCRGHRLRLDQIEQQFPAFRRQPEFWRAGRRVAAAAHRPQPRLRRGRPTLAHPVADHSAG